MKIAILLIALLVALTACGSGGGDGSGGVIVDDTQVDDDSGAGDDTVIGDDTNPDDDSAPAPALAIACTDATEDVYVTPADLPPYDPSRRGDIVRCAPADSASLDEVRTMLADISGVDAKSGYHSYRIAYRTERDPGVAGVGTALLMIPDAPDAGPLPLIVGTHGTAGLADACAPSNYEVASQMEGPELLAAWAANGYPVVAPDYAGLGNEGTQGYHNTADTAHSTLDAARAAIKALVPGSVDGRVIVEGHSQGGGAALAAQAYARTYSAPDLDVIAVIAYAAGYPSGREIDAFLLPSLPIDGGGGMVRTVEALSYYADFANLFGLAHAPDPFDPSIRDFVASAVETECVFSLTADLALSSGSYTPPVTFGELIDPTFRQEMADCLTSENCTARATAFRDRAEPDAAPLDPQGARVLMISGTADILETPALQACLRDQLIADGVTPDVCVYEGETHSSVMTAAAGFALQWAFDPDAVCPNSATLPDCAY